MRSGTAYPGASTFDPTLRTGAEPKLSPSQRRRIRELAAERSAAISLVRDFDEDLRTVAADRRTLLAEIGGLEERFARRRVANPNLPAEVDAHELELALAARRRRIARLGEYEIDVRKRRDDAQRRASLADRTGRAALLAAGYRDTIGESCWDQLARLERY